MIKITVVFSWSANQYNMELAITLWLPDPELRFNDQLIRKIWSYHLVITCPKLRFTDQLIMQIWSHAGNSGFNDQLTLSDIFFFFLISWRWTSGPSTRWISWRWTRWAASTPPMTRRAWWPSSPTCDAIRWSAPLAARIPGKQTYVQPHRKQNS